MHAATFISRIVLWLPVLRWRCRGLKTSHTQHYIASQRVPQTWQIFCCHNTCCTLYTRIHPIHRLWQYPLVFFHLTSVFWTPEDNPNRWFFTFWATPSNHCICYEQYRSVWAFYLLVYCLLPPSHCWTTSNIVVAHASVTPMMIENRRFHQV